MNTKEQKKERKDKKVAEWIGVFRRSYEMSRAYGKNIELSVWCATKDLNKKINSDWEQSPRERMFFIDCKQSVVSMLKDTVISEEKSAKEMENACHV